MEKSYSTPAVIKKQLDELSSCTDFDDIQRQKLNKLIDSYSQYEEYYLEYMNAIEEESHMLLWLTNYQSELNKLTLPVKDCSLGELFFFHYVLS